METKYARIPEIKKGVVFSDPWYKADVWCQYRKSFSAKDWVMELQSRVEDGYVYFQMKLGRPTASRGVNTSKRDDGSVGIAYPYIYNIDQVELGMDTACIYCGNMENWQKFGEAAAIRTGTDGMFGDLMVFTCRGETDPAGFLLMGVLDESFGNEEEIFKHLNASFNGQEITQELYSELCSQDSLSYQLCAAREAKHANVARFPQREDNEKEPER